MHTGLCEQYVKSLGLTPTGFHLLFRTRPRALWQQTPPEPVLIPLTYHGGRVTQICVSKLERHSLRQWRVTSSASSQFLPQCGLENRLQKSRNFVSYISVLRHHAWDISNEIQTKWQKCVTQDDVSFGDPSENQLHLYKSCLLKVSQQVALNFIKHD